MSERFQATSFQLGGSFVQDLSGFRQATQQIGGFFADKRVKQAALEGAVAEFDEEGKPILPEQGSQFFRSERARSEASIKAYQAEVQSDVMESFARIQAENPDNPEAFQSAIDGFKVGLFAEIADPIKANIAQLVRNLETQGKISVRGEFITRTNAESKVSSQKVQKDFKNASMNALFNGDLIRANAARTSFIESLDSPLFSPEEAQDIIDAFDEEALETGLLGTVDRLAEGNVKNAFEHIEAFKDIDPTELNFSPTRQSDLARLAYGSILNKVKLAETIETVGDQETKRSQDANEADMTSKAYDNNLSDAEFKTAMKNRTLSPAAGVRIRKIMNSSLAIKDDPALVVDIERDISDLPLADVQKLIDNGVENNQLTASTAARLERTANAREAKEEDTKVDIDRKLLRSLTKPLTGPGARRLDPAAEARQAFAIAEFERRIADGDDPTTVREEVFNDFNKGNKLILDNLSGTLEFGSVKDLDGAELEVNQAEENRDITREQAVQQMELIEVMKRLKLGEVD